MARGATTPAAPADSTPDADATLADHAAHSTTAASATPFIDYLSVDVPRTAIPVTPDDSVTVPDPPAESTTTEPGLIVILVNPAGPIIPGTPNDHLPVPAPGTSIL
jgi:hypothetical protein